MVKVIEDLKPNRSTNIIKSINKISNRLDSLKEDIQDFPEKYDLNTLVDILAEMYDDIGDFNITVYEEQPK